MTAQALGSITTWFEQRESSLKKQKDHLSWNLKWEETSLRGDIAMVQYFHLGTEAATLLSIPSVVMVVVSTFVLGMASGDPSPGAPYITFVSKTLLGTGIFGALGSGILHWLSNRSIQKTVDQLTKNSDAKKAELEEEIKPISKELQIVAQAHSSLITLQSRPLVCDQLVSEDQ